MKQINKVKVDYHERLFFNKSDPRLLIFCMLQIKSIWRTSFLNLYDLPGKQLIVKLFAALKEDA